MLFCLCTGTEWAIVVVGLPTTTKSPMKHKVSTHLKQLWGFQHFCVLEVDIFFYTHSFRSHIKILEEANPIVAAASSGPDPMAVLGQLFGGGATPMPVAGLPPFSVLPPAGSEGSASSAQCKLAFLDQVEGGGSCVNQWQGVDPIWTKCPRLREKVHLF